MTRQTATQTQQQTPTANPLSRGGILQRKCESCGQHTIASGECTECQKKKQSLQHNISNFLNQSIDPETSETLAKSSFQADFSRVVLQNSSSSVLRPKLRMGQTDDQYEVEADRIAEQVTQLPVSSVASKPKTRAAVQLKSDPSMASSDSLAPVPPIVHEVLRSPGQPLDMATRAFFEPRFGQDFSAVRVHTDSLAAKSAEAISAKAFAYRHHIAFAAGSYDPSSDQGKRLLAHELTHVLQQPGHVACNPDGQSAPCRTGLRVGVGSSQPQDHSRGASGTYIIQGPIYNDEDAPTYSDQSIEAWITWRFRTLSPAVASRIRAEATHWNWTWDTGLAPQRGCQYVTRMSVADMNRLVALANRDPAARQAEGREGRAGLPELPPPEPIADFEIVVIPGTGGSGGQTATPREINPREATEQALDPTSIYEAGAPGSNLPPFLARIEGPGMEVPRGIGTFIMVLDYAATTSDPLLQMAYYMNLVSYHWELYDVTQMVRAGIGKGVEEETRRLGQTMGQSSQAASAASGATRQRAEHTVDQLSEETIRSWQELRDPRRSAEGGSAVDVITRTWANQLNLTLLPASAIIAAGGQALGALSDLMGAYSQEREIAFPRREGFYMVRCIAQPTPRGPNQSERRAASVQTKIVEVRQPETLARNAIEMPDAVIQELRLRRAMTSDAAEIQRLDAQIATIQEQTSGDIVIYLTHLIEQKQREHDSAPSWQRSRLARELESLRLRLSQAQRHRGGAGTLHRPRAAFTSLVTGDTYPLMLELSEITVERGFRVRLMDLTVPDREPIERNGSSREQAVRNAFNELAFHGDLGRGRLVVRMPDTWTDGPRELSLQTGDASTAIVRRRLQDLATALLVLSLVVPGVGEASAVIAAGLAVDRLARRALNNTLRLDAESVSDTLAILGAIAQGAQLIGRLRVHRAGQSFIATVRTGDEAAIQTAVRTLETARRTGRVLDVTSLITNVGGLVWGDLVTLDRLAQIQQDELDGRITHAAARRQRAEMLAAAVRDHGIMLAGMLRPQQADRVSGVEPPPRESTPPTSERSSPAEGTPPRQTETIPEPELERRAQQAAVPRANGQPVETRPEGVRSRFRTPDNLHEIFILNDGRIFRCSLTCAQLRTWYNSYFTAQPEGTRRQEATQLDGELQSLERRAAAGENTEALRNEIAALDVHMREFIAPDLGRELQSKFASHLRPGEPLLTDAQMRTLLRVMNVDAIQAIPDVASVRQLANLWSEVLSTASSADIARIRSLNERLGLTAEQIQLLQKYLHARRDVRDVLSRAITDLEAARTLEDFEDIARQPAVVPPGAAPQFVTRIYEILNNRRIHLDAGLTALLREYLEVRRNSLDEALSAIERSADQRQLLTRLRAAAESRSPSTEAAPGARHPRYRHAVDGHGSQLRPQDLLNEAANRRGTGVPQGQFYNNATMVEADNLAPRTDGEHPIDFRRPIGRVYMSDGTVVSDVTRVLVFRRNGDTFFDAYPIDPTR